MEKKEKILNCVICGAVLIGFSIGELGLCSEKCTEISEHAPENFTIGLTGGSNSSNSNSTSILGIGETGQSGPVG
ncbi:hypothetical protein K2P96_02630 [Patescibacteria group bacterium]|nr:hypothetical protein [Patescibacteria group bacterium]